MATIKEATENAAAFARETLGPARTQGLRLEEIVAETENGHDVWHITLSMVAEENVNGLNQLGLALGAIGPKRDYKVFAVRKDTGEVTAMRIRELSNV
jgi:hypothetical protein